MPAIRFSKSTPDSIAPSTSSLAPKTPSNRRNLSRSSSYTPWSAADCPAKGGAFVGGGGAGDSVCSGVPLGPVLVYLAGLAVGVRAVEEDDLTGELGPFEDAIEVLLRAPRLSGGDF